MSAEPCPHDEYTFTGEVMHGHVANTVKIHLVCGLCGALYEWLPFMAVEKDSGDLLLSARVVEPPKILKHSTTTETSDE